MQSYLLTRTILQQHIDRKKKSFPDFSLRWLAKQLSVSPAYLSQVMRGNRLLRPELVEPICRLLDIDIEKQELIEVDLLKHQGWAKVPKKGARGLQIAANSHLEPWSNASKPDVSQLLVWENIAILEATQLKGYDGSADYLSRRLGLSIELVQHTLNLLTVRGYLQERDGRLQKSDKYLEFQSRSDKNAIRTFHSKALKLAQAELIEKTQDIDLEYRLITSSLLTVSKQHLPALKAKISEFVRELGIESAETEEDEVYQLAVAFFPVTAGTDHVDFEPESD